MVSEGFGGMVKIGRIEGWMHCILTTLSDGPERMRLFLNRAGPLLFVASLAGCSLSESPPASQTPPAFYASLASPSARVDAHSARDLINGYRRNLGLAPVAVDATLMRFAEEQVAALARADKVDATRDATLGSRLKGSGIITVAALENVSAGYHTVSDAFSGWRGSPRHDATLRMPAARRFGIATAYNPASKYKVYWVLVAAAP